MARTDYYQTLGVSKSADEKEIKKAYRKLAKKYHPDTNPGDAAAEQRFKEVTEAYNVLSDQEKRKLYDQYGFAAFDESAGGSAGDSTPHGNHYSYHFEGGDDDDIFEDLFGNMFHGGFANSFHGGYGQEKSRSARENYGYGTASARGQDAESDITVSFEEAALGCDKTIQLQTNDPASGIRIQSLKVHIPAGIEEGKKIRLFGKGGPGARGGNAGDLFLKVHIRESERYERKGMDVYVKVPIPFTTAALGGEAKISTLYGDVVCRIPEGTQGGSKIRLKNKGIVSMKNQSLRGDEYAVIQIKVPTRLSPEEKEKIRELSL